MIAVISASKASDQRKGEQAMPTLIQVSPNGGGRYIGVDREGQVWRGEVKRSRGDGEDYIAWKPMHSEFPGGK